MGEGRKFFKEKQHKITPEHTYINFSHLSSRHVWIGALKQQPKEIEHETQ